MSSTTVVSVPSGFILVTGLSVPRPVVYLAVRTIICYEVPITSKRKEGAGCYLAVDGPADPVYVVESCATISERIARAIHPNGGRTEIVETDSTGAQWVVGSEVAK